MFRNYFKIAVRNFLRNKAFSFINIFGLAAGLATCLLIMLYIFSETGYDRQFHDADDIYRLAIGATTSGGQPTGEKNWAANAAPVARGMKEDLPEVEESARLLKYPNLDKMLLKYEEGSISKQFYETNGFYVDSSFFRIFNYPMAYGQGATALNEPNSIVVSQSIALKIFGKDNPLGKTIKVGLPFGIFPYRITGVFRDDEVKSHIPAHFFLSMRNGDVGHMVDQMTNWATNNVFYTYFKLKPGVDLPLFKKKLNQFIIRRAGSDLKALGVQRLLIVQPVKDIYLHSDFDGEISPNGNITYLYLLGSIALFILLIACINFMNLSTARSAKRAREVGIRKAMGAVKGSLILQFLGESMLMSVLALLLALCLAWLLLPFFNSLTQKNLQLLDDPKMVFWLASLTLLTGLLSGLYPAFYLSAFRPILVLKGRLVNHFSSVMLRKGLVVFQFTISIFLVCGAIVIERQLHFLKSQPLGFAKNQRIIMPLQDADAVKHFATLRDELLKNPRIKSVTCGSTYPGIENIEDMPFYAETKSVRDNVDLHLGTVGNDYFQTLGLTLLEGRPFSREYSMDSNSIILNEKAVSALGYDRKHAVGRKISYDFEGYHREMEIVGVVKDFNYESLYNTIKPFAFSNNMGNKYNFLIASLATNDYAILVRDLENVWKKINPSVPFVYSFLDQDLEKNYEKDQRTSGIVRYFTLMAILIACLGLFGLSAFSAEQRFKEIGIRKVLGASATRIAGLLSRDFVTLVGISILIASPLAWYAMNRWLEGFAYHTRIHPGLFLLAGLMATGIALITVSFQSVKAAMANPVKSLRAE